MTGKVFAAVDLGATSGRVIAGRIEGGRLRTEETARFRNDPVVAPGPAGRPTLHWDVLRLWAGMQEGLTAAARRFGTITSVGIDSWAVDHGLLDPDGDLLGNPVHYRDERTIGAAERFFLRFPAERHYAVTGVQVQPFNTVFQLVAAAGTARLAASARLLLIPDLFSAWLTGVEVAELTNASTTGLLDASTLDWNPDVVAAASHVTGVDIGRILPPVVASGTSVGPVRSTVGRAWGLEGTEVVTVGSHDTASAVAAVPFDGDGAAYISSGTWSLVGLELDRPVLTAEARKANFTNELGVHGTVRFLRNVTGLWLLEQSLATWARQGRQEDLATLLNAARTVPGLRCVVDPDDEALAAPGDMPARIRDLAERSGQRVPESPAEVTRVILDSLALAYRRALRDAVRLTGRQVHTVHVVGGGARNELLCQLTADATAMPVLAGPDEGTAMGNLLLQAGWAGEASGSLDGMRAIVRASTRIRRYQPAGDDVAWDRAERALGR